MYEFIESQEAPEQMLEEQQNLLQEEKNELQEFERDIVYWRSNYETS
jgi:hypothetical protein